MTFAEFADILEACARDPETAERTRPEITELIGAVLPCLGPVSLQTMRQFQRDFGIEHGSNLPPFAVFARQQNEKLAECIRLEASVFGQTVARTLGREHIEPGMTFHFADADKLREKLDLAALVT